MKKKRNLRDALVYYVRIDENKNKENRANLSNLIKRKLLYYYDYRNFIFLKGRGRNFLYLM